jgi:hypothetical protein
MARPLFSVCKRRHSFSRSYHTVRTPPAPRCPQTGTGDGFQISMAKALLRAAGAGGERVHRLHQLLEGVDGGPPCPALAFRIFNNW